MTTVSEELCQRVLNALSLPGCDTLRQIVARTGVSTATGSRALRQLKAEGRVVHCGKQKTGTWNYENLWDVAS